VRGARVAIAVWLAFVVACAWIAARAHYNADMSAFLPRTPTPSQQILVDQLREGVVSRVLLVGIEGAQPEVLAQISNALAERLSHAPEISYVNNGDEQRLTADGEFLFRQRYLLSPGVTAARFTVEGLREALTDDLDLLASPLGTLMSRVLPADPTGELLRLLENLQLEGGPPKREGVWFSSEGKRALLVIQTRAAGFDLDAQERVHAAVRAAFADIAREHQATQASIVMSGPGVFAVESRASIKSDVSRISLLAIVIVFSTLLFVYRSLRVVALTLLPVVSGVLAGVAAVSIAFGSVHGVTLGFGATLLGEGVDYAIYYFTNVAGAARSGSLARIWPTLRLGVLTSAVGFSVLVLSQFSGLAQLGVFSIAGLVVAFCVTRFVLPQLAPARLNAAAPIAFAGRWLTGLVQRARVLRWPLVVAVVVSVAWIAWRAGSIWDDRLESLSPVSAAAKRLDESLRKDLSAPDARYLLVVEADSLQAVLERAERLGAALGRLQTSGAIAGFDSPASVLPSEKTQRERQAALPDSGPLQAALARAVRGLPFRSDIFQPFLKDVAAARMAPLLDRSNLKGTGLALRVDTLLLQRRGEWVALLPLRGVRDAGELAAAATGIEGAQLLDLKQEADSLYRGYRVQATLFALLGAIAIALLLLGALRSVKRALDVLLPLAAAVAVTCAVFTIGDRQLTMFHLIGLLLVVGVGSNYSLFFERETLVRTDRELTVVSVVLCNFSTIVGFGLLSWARAPVLSAIGGTVALGAFLSLVFAAILQSSRTVPGPSCAPDSNELR
jgi:predicted exporter